MVSQQIRPKISTTSVSGSTTPSELRSLFIIQLPAGCNAEARLRVSLAEKFIENKRGGRMNLDTSLARLFDGTGFLIQPERTGTRRGALKNTRPIIRDGPRSVVLSRRLRPGNLPRLPFSLSLSFHLPHPPYNSRHPRHFREAAAEVRKRMKRHERRAASECVLAWIKCITRVLRSLASAENRGHTRSL